MSAIGKTIPLLCLIFLALSAGCTTGDNGTPRDNEEPSDPCSVSPGAYDGGMHTAFDPMTIPEDRGVFPMPVQAGAMTSGSVILTAYTASQANVVLWVWRIPHQGDGILLVLDQEVVPRDGYIKTEVTGLAPKTVYHYAFFVAQGETLFERSVAGRFKTALPDDCAEPVTISGTHGTNTRHKPFTALEIMARYDVDAFMQLGDYSYNDGAGTVEQFREKWAGTLDDPGFWALLPTVGQYIVWDDHEFRNNDVYYRDLDTPDFLAAKDAFYERNPVPRFSNDSHWNSYRWGKTVEFFVLDNRSERLYAIPELQLGPIRFMSVEQMEWLKQSLYNSPCHFKVLLNSSPLSDFPGFWDFVSYDRWEGFEEQRSELLNFIVEKGIDNVWSLSGDFHVGTVNKVEKDPPRDSVREVLMGPGGNRNPFMWVLYEDLGWEEAVAPADQFDFFYGFQTATLMTFDPEDGAVEIVFIDAETEEVLFDRTLY